MNYTRPDSVDTTDDPKDWLNCALIFTRSLSFLLRESEGIIIDITGDVDVKNIFDKDEIKKVIVYKKEERVHILPFEDDLSEGTMIWVDEDQNSLN